MSIESHQSNEIAEAASADDLARFARLVKKFSVEERAEALRAAMNSGPLAFAAKVLKKYATPEDRAAQHKAVRDTVLHLCRADARGTLAWCLEAGIPVADLVQQLMQFCPNDAAPALVELGIVDMTTPLDAVRGNATGRHFFVLVLDECEDVVLDHLLAAYTPQQIVDSFLGPWLVADRIPNLERLFRYITEPVTLCMEIAGERVPYRVLEFLKMCPNLTISATNGLEASEALSGLSLLTEAVNYALYRLLAASPEMSLIHRAHVRQQLVFAVRRRSHAWVELVVSRGQADEELVAEVLSALPAESPADHDSARWLVEETKLPLPASAALRQVADEWRRWLLLQSDPTAQASSRAFVNYLDWLAGSLDRRIPRRLLAEAYRSFLLASEAAPAALEAAGAPVAPSAAPATAPSFELSVRYVANLETGQFAALVALLGELEVGRFVEVHAAMPGKNGLRRTELTVASMAVGLMAASLEDGQLATSGWDRLLVRA